ncbi:MAG: deiodinase iodothyronine type [Planctomycetota bacterium]|nr:MAG: deiodinase iodothyronine type [Planctomycetota bacterium]
MYQRWKDEVNFLIVYISEAHPWPRKSKKKGKTVLPEPRTIEERDARGEFCTNDLGLTIPMVLDGMDNKVGEKYAGMPDRIYVLDQKGMIVWKSGPGPFGFIPWKAARAFRSLLGKWPKTI